MKYFWYECRIVFLIYITGYCYKMATNTRAQKYIVNLLITYKRSTQPQVCSVLYTGVFKNVRFLEVQQSTGCSHVVCFMQIFSLETELQKYVLNLLAIQQNPLTAGFAVLFIKTLLYVRLAFIICYFLKYTEVCFQSPQ